MKTWRGRDRERGNSIDDVCDWERNFRNRKMLEDTQIVSILDEAVQISRLDTHLKEIQNTSLLNERY